MSQLVQGKMGNTLFYPKDNTSGCTTEALEFSALRLKFEELNAVILGVSPDSCQSHQKFIAKHNLTVTLLSDPSKEVLTTYGAWKLKKRYGKEYMGVVRSTYLIDPHGRIAKIWKNVRARGHAEKVLQELMKQQEEQEKD